MKIYVLFIILQIANFGSVTTHEFNTPEACETARHKAAIIMDAYAFCVEDNLSPPANGSSGTTVCLENFKPIDCDEYEKKYHPSQSKNQVWKAGTYPFTGRYVDEPGGGSGCSALCGGGGGRSFNSGSGKTYEAGTREDIEQ